MARTDVGPVPSDHGGGGVRADTEMVPANVMVPVNAIGARKCDSVPIGGDGPGEHASVGVTAVSDTSVPVERDGV